MTFVLGTDTGVGKTRLMTDLARALDGFCTCYLVKAVQTGVGERDADRYRAVVSPDRVWEGYGFALPIDPMSAARHEGKTIDPYFLADRVRGLLREGGHVLVEGSGGILSPVFDDGAGITVLMRILGPTCRSFLVGSPHLGALNQILSACRILEMEGMTPAAVFLYPRTGVTDEATVRNPETLRTLLPGIPVLLMDPLPPPD